MKCPKCNKIIKNSSASCKYCGLKIEKNNDKIVYKIVEKETNKWLILGISILAFIILLETTFVFWYLIVKKQDDVLNVKIIEDNKAEIPNIENVRVNNYYLGESFIFDGFRLSISSNYTIEKLDNKYSIYNGKDVIKVPVTIKNLKNVNNSFNIFKYNIYGPNMNEIDEVAQYFDEGLFYIKDLKPNESVTKYFYFLYDCNGKYLIKFEDNSSVKNIILNVYK